MIFGFEKFRPYFIGFHVIVDIDQSSHKQLLSTKESKSILARWILLLQELDSKIRDKKHSENRFANHLSRIICDRELESYNFKFFPNKELFSVHPDHWQRMIEFLRVGLRMININSSTLWNSLFRITLASLSTMLAESLEGVFQTMRLGVYFPSFTAKHLGTFQWEKDSSQRLQYGFYWSTIFRDYFQCCKNYPRCQQLGRISRRYIMEINPIIVVEIFLYSGYRLYKTIFLFFSK